MLTGKPRCVARSTGGSDAEVFLQLSRSATVSTTGYIQEGGNDLSRHLNVENPEGLDDCEDSEHVVADSDVDVVHAETGEGNTSLPVRCPSAKIHLYYFSKYQRMRVHPWIHGSRLDDC